MSARNIPPFSNLNRRDALRGLAACSFILAGPRIKVVHAEEISNLQEETKKYDGAAMPGGLKDSPLLFLAIAPDGTVTFLCNRVADKKKIGF